MSLNPSFRNDERGFEMLGDRVERVRDRAGRRGEIDLHRDRGAQNFVASRRISSGMVAPKSRVCRWAGTCLIIFRISGRKPISNIRSASSNTSTSRKEPFPATYSLTTLIALGPFGLASVSKLTLSPSARLLKPSPWMDVWWTKASSLGHFFYLLIHNIKSQKVSPKKRPQSQKSLWPL